MKVSFRQGIIKCKMINSSTPTVLFIQPNGAGTAIDLIATLQEPTSITFAHYSADYLIEETRNITSAWGGGVDPVPGAATDINNSALSVSGVQYLYWDIDLGTGALRRGWTSVPIVISGTAPSSPVNDTHWFDTTTTRMRVWRTLGSSGQWLDKIRVFAGVYTSLGTIAPIVPTVIGSQVGITGGNYGAGNLLLGANNKPLRQSDGTFATTETDLIVFQTSGQNVRFDMALVFAQAAEEIPKYSLVRFMPDRRIGLASSLDAQNFISGMVVEDLTENTVGQVVTNGAIRNDQWSWAPSAINKPLFCNSTGALTLTAPTIGVSQQVGFVYDVDAIYLNLFPPVRL